MILAARSWINHKINGGHKLRKDGSDRKKVVDHPHASNPSWSPDGKWLIYTRTPQKTTGIYTLNLESGEESDLFIDGECPDWRKQTRP